jgi:hypothetical protein
MAEHYAAVERATGRKAEHPELPTALRYLWNHFILLHKARGSNGFGPNPLAWSEIRAYCELMQARLDPWEIEAIKVVDDEYLASVVESTSEQGNGV